MTIDAANTNTAPQPTDGATPDVPQYDNIQTIKDMIAHNKEGKTKEAEDCFSQIVSHKTADLLANWYHLSGDVKQHLGTRVVAPQS